MIATLSTAALALNVLHYLAPLCSGTYFVTAKTISACLLQQPTKHPRTRTWRYIALALQSAVVSTAAAEGIASIVRAVRQAPWTASQDYTVYLIVEVMLHVSLLVGVAETSSPVWHPYLGAWVSLLGFDIAIVVLQGIRVRANNYEKARLALSCLRVAFLLALCIFFSWRVLSDRPKPIRLDDESEGLLAAPANAHINGTTKRTSTSPKDSVHIISNGHDTSIADDQGDSAENDDDYDFDSDSEEPERDKELKAQQKKRLQESGNYMAYLKDFKIFIPMLFPRKDRLAQGCLVLIGLCIIATRILNVLVPTQLGKITNELAKLAGTGEMPWRDVGLYLLYATLSSSAGISMIKEIAQMPVHQYGHRAIATTSFRHVMELDQRFHNEKNSGELIRAIDQGSNLQDLISFGLFTVVPMIFDLVVAFVYVSYLFDIYMGMILGAVGFAFVWVGAKTTIWSLKRRRAWNEAWRTESKVQNEAINNWQTVSHFNRGEYETKRYTDSVLGFQSAEWGYLAAHYLGAGAQNSIMVFGRLAAFSIAAYRVAQGRASVGQFITLIQYWRSIESPLGAVTYSVRRVSSMLTDSERLLQLLTTEPTVKESSDATVLNIKEGEVRFEKVNFHYDPRKSTLKNIDFVVKPGQTVALVGETGGGKSTILKLLYRYYDVTEGAIRIDGQDVRDVTLDSLRDAFGMVPQDPSLFNVSIMENIKYARLDATDDEVKEACKAAAIHEKIESFPDGYKAKVGERGVKLSGGELQRVSIARAILRQSKIVLLDEATSMIDAETEALIQDAFKRLTAKRTTFVVAHRLSTIQHADLILVISDGEIVERGTHDELFRLKGKYVALWSKQLSKDVQEIGAKLDIASSDQNLIDLGNEEVDGGAESNSRSLDHSSKN